MKAFPYPLATVGGFIIAPDGDLLLVRSHKWKDKWTVPGGKVEIGETVEEAFVREVREETELNICNVRFAIIQDWINPTEFWKPAHFIFHDFISDLSPNSSKDSVVLNDEAEEYLWISPDKVKKMQITQGTKILIDWYLTTKEAK